MLERAGAEGALLVTRGFEDLLVVRDQRREDLFALRQRPAPPLFDRVCGLRERVSAEGEVLEELDEEQLETLVAELVRDKVPVVAVALLNACANPVHEQRVRERLEAAGLEHVSVSHEVSLEFRVET